jgi:hypothetical protein
VYSAVVVYKCVNKIQLVGEGPVAVCCEQGFYKGRRIFQLTARLSARAVLQDDGAREGSVLRNDAVKC